MQAFASNTVYETIAEARRRFQGHQPLEAGHPIRQEILRSWQRCRKAGVDPKTAPARYLDREKFAEILRRNATLMEVALPVIDILYSTTLRSNTNMLLTDNKGIILHSKGFGTGFGNRPSCSLQGIDVSESVDGTTAMGLCLVEKKPVHVTGPEHYKNIFDNWHCTAAPILDTYGTIIGTVCFVIDCSDLHPHTLGMVAAASSAITEQIKLRLLLHNQRTILDLLNEGVVVLDKELRIWEMNPHACKLFALREPPLGRTITTIIRNEGNFARLREKAPVSDKDVTFTLTDGTEVNCNLSVSPTGGGGIIINLRERGRLQRFAKRFIGATAKYTFDDILGDSAPMQQVIRLARAASSNDASVLVLGESGVGKELIAQAIHNDSNRKNGPFIAVNCGAIPRDLVQTELFGYEPGAFTGASREGMLGKFEMADHGTLFLDEIGDMALNVQVNLLRVLQEGIVTRVGGKVARKVDVRVIAATHRNLSAGVESGSFRRDLYYRLNVLSIRVPPLRERGSDTALLAEFFLKKYTKTAGKEILGFSPDVLDCLEDYRWPGNVRELENIIERATIVTQRSHIHRGDLPLELLAQCPPSILIRPGAGAAETLPDLAESALPLNESGTLRELEADVIVDTLRKTRGNIRAAAKLLGISRGTLYSRLKRYGLDPGAVRE